MFTSSVYRTRLFSGGLLPCLFIRGLLTDTAGNRPPSKHSQLGSAAKFNAHGLPGTYFSSGRRKMTHRTAFTFCFQLQSKLRAGAPDVTNALPAQVRH